MDLRDFYISTEWDVMEVPAVRNEKYYPCCEVSLALALVLFLVLFLVLILFLVLVHVLVLVLVNLLVEVQNFWLFQYQILSLLSKVFF